MTQNRTNVRMNLLQVLGLDITELAELEYIHSLEVHNYSL
jgi:hypothetical protein